jgi:hypothetical protein
MSFTQILKNKNDIVNLIDLYKSKIKTTNSIDTVFAFLSVACFATLLAFQPYILMCVPFLILLVYMKRKKNYDVFKQHPISKRLHSQFLVFTKKDHNAIIKETEHHNQETLTLFEELNFSLKGIKLTTMSSETIFFHLLLNSIDKSEVAELIKNKEDFFSVLNTYTENSQDELVKTFKRKIKNNIENSKDEINDLINESQSIKLKINKEKRKNFSLKEL